MEFHTNFPLVLARLAVNQIFYCAMHHIYQHKKPIVAGFVHIPPLPIQVARRNAKIPSWPLDFTKKAILIILDAIIKEL